MINLSALLEGKSSNHLRDFYCLNCFNSCTSKNKLKEHEEICNNHNSCRTQMLNWFEKILKYSPGEKSDYDMLLMVKKGIRGRICQSTHRYVKAKNKYIDICIYTYIYIFVSIFVNISAV